MKKREKALLAKRQILLQGRIAADVQERISSHIIYLNALDQESPITLFIDSLGGEIGSGFMIVDAVQNSVAPIHGIVIGAAYSISFTVLQACKHRSAYEHASVMFHASSPNGIRIDRDDFDEVIAKLREADQAELESFAQRSGQPFEKIQKWATAEKRFAAPEAKTLGFLDEIIRPKP